MDEDSGKNSAVRYSLEMIAPNTDDKVFEIDSVTGSIRTKQELDRETRDTYKFKVSNNTFKHFKAMA